VRPVGSLSPRLEAIFNGIGYEGVIVLGKAVAGNLGLDDGIQCSYAHVALYGPMHAQGWLFAPCFIGLTHAREKPTLLL